MSQDNSEIETKKVKKVNKTADKTTYMREYMRKYNAKRATPRKLLTEEQKKINLRKSQKKYYDKNKEAILNQKLKKNKTELVEKLKAKLDKLETL